MQRPQDRADRRGGGRPLRRVRVLRAGLPEQGSHAHPAQAHRAAPRDGARRAVGRHRAARARCRRTTSTTACRRCAVDGMCQTACPVLINTGDLVRRLRAETASAVEQAGWNTAAKHWDAGTRLGGIALSAAHAVPSALPIAVTKLARAVLGRDTVPEYSATLPAGGSRRRVLTAAEPVAVYFPSCTTTMFGPEGEQRAVPGASANRSCGCANAQASRCRPRTTSPPCAAGPPGSRKG